MSIWIEANDHIYIIVCVVESIKHTFISHLPNLFIHYFFSYEQGQTPWNIPKANIQISIHFYEIWSKKHIISLRRMENERTK